MPKIENKFTSKVDGAPVKTRIGSIGLIAAHSRFEWKPLSTTKNTPREHTMSVRQTNAHERAEFLCTHRRAPPPSYGGRGRERRKSRFVFSSFVQFRSLAAASFGVYGEANELV